jgi:dynein assembly factor 1, axonemal
VKVQCPSAIFSAECESFSEDIEMEMSKALLRKLCKDNGLYGTPSINDKIYLHYKGFSKIQNLEEYTGLKALWLEGNGLTEISGLENQTLLRSLFLHENLIEKIQGLENQLELDSLNLSKNFVKKIENLSHMKKLTNLNLSHNAISKIEDIDHILEIPSLQTIDLQHNKIEDPAIVDVLAQLPDLRVVYLMGNPVVKNIRNYRKTIISRCKMLKYLDDRPVFEDERRRTDAWARVIEAGGSQEEAAEAEREEIALIRKEKDDADERNFRAFEQLMKEGQEIRRLREQAKAEGQAVETVNPFSGETIIDVPESEELRLLREKRWQSYNGSSDMAPLPPAPPAESQGPSTLMPPAPPTRQEEKLAMEESEKPSTPVEVTGMRKMVIEEVADDENEDEVDEDNEREELDEVDAHSDDGGDGDDDQNDIEDPLNESPSTSVSEVTKLTENALMQVTLTESDYFALD